MLALVVLPVGSACSQEAAPPPAMEPNTNSPDPIPPDVMKQLSFGTESELAVVFAVNRKGEIKAYYNPKGKPTPKGQLKFPKKNDEIELTRSITLFQTKNPTTCWINSRGTQECVTWP
jgi:hypothetical protein